MDILPLEVKLSQEKRKGLSYIIHLILSLSDMKFNACKNMPFFIFFFFQRNKSNKINFTDKEIKDRRSLEMCSIKASFIFENVCKSWTIWIFLFFKKKKKEVLIVSKLILIGLSSLCHKISVLKNSAVWPTTGYLSKSNLC